MNRISQVFEYIIIIECCKNQFKCMQGCGIVAATSLTKNTDSNFYYVECKFMTFLTSTSQTWGCWY